MKPSPDDCDRNRPKVLLAPRLYGPLVDYLLTAAPGNLPQGMLGVLGPPGWGKTTGVIAALQDAGAVVMTANPEMFGSPLEGGSCKAVKEFYLRAVRRRAGGAGGPVAVALLLDDFHLALGRDDRTSATTNYGLTVGLLQGLIDNPSRVLGAPTPYLPIYLTLNTLDGLPASLRRPGRLRVLHWSYTRPELARIVCQMFPRVGRKHALALIDERPGEPVSFYADLRRAWAARRRRIDRGAARADLELAVRGLWQPPAGDEPTGKQLLRFAAAFAPEPGDCREGRP